MGVLVIVIGIALTLLYAYALCYSAKRSIKQEGRENEMLEAQRAYNEYRRKFAQDRNISIEEATDYQAVKNYKQYLEKEHNVVIVEGGV